MDKKKEQKTRTINMKLPEILVKRLKDEAFETRKTMTALVSEALQSRYR